MEPLLTKNTNELTLTQKISLWLSSLCLIHCLITPFIILLLPSISSFLSGWMETALVLAIIPVSLISFVPIWLKHKNKSRMIELLSGILLVSIALMLPDRHQISEFSWITLSETFLMVLGALLISVATYKNRRHTHHCDNPHHTH